MITCCCCWSIWMSCSFWLSLSWFTLNCWLFCWGGGLRFRFLWFWNRSKMVLSMLSCTEGLICKGPLKVEKSFSIHCCELGRNPILDYLINPFLNILISIIWLLKLMRNLLWSTLLFFLLFIFLLIKFPQFYHELTQRIVNQITFEFITWSLEIIKILGVIKFIVHLRWWNFFWNKREEEKLPILQVTNLGTHGTK